MCLFSASVANLSFDILHWCVQPQPLALLEEDIREVLKEETGADIFTQVQNQLQYRSYEVLAIHTCFHSHANRFSLNIQKVSSYVNSYIKHSFLFLNCVIWCSQQMEAPARKVRKSLVLDNWEKDCLNVQLFPQQQINNNAVVRPLSYSTN